MKSLPVGRNAMSRATKIIVSTLGAVVLGYLVVALPTVKDNNRRLNYVQKLAGEMRLIAERTQDDEAQEVFNYFLIHMIPAKPIRDGIRYLRDTPVSPVAIVTLMPGDEKLSSYWQNAANLTDAGAYYDPKYNWIIIPYRQFSLRTRAIILFHEVRHAYCFTRDPSLARAKVYPGLHELETMEFGWRIADKMSQGAYQRTLTRYLARMSKMQSSRIKDGIMYLPVNKEELATLYGPDGPAINDEERAFRANQLAYDASLRAMSKNYPSSKLRRTQAEWVTLHVTSSILPRR